MTDKSSIIPGVTRMQDVDGFVGTIVYVGPVASAKDPKEEYAGIVWDDPSRGKHDGSVVCRTTNQLVRHFSCPHPCGASFVRLKKLDLGLALDESVLRSKYVTAEAPMVAPNNILPHTARTSGGREKPIEFYGELQIRSKQQLEDLNTISLRRMGIARYDSSIPLDDFKHLTALDLAGNLISDWETVLFIMKQFPALESFSVAANRIQDPTEKVMQTALAASQQAPFPSLQIFNLNQCGVSSVQTFIWIGKIMPRLQDLCVAHANLSGLSRSHINAKSFQQLRILDCSSCKLSSWNDQIVPLCSNLPCLERLSLDENPIYTTNLENDEEREVYFPQLTSLQLAGTQIQNWRDLDGLTKMPKLISLRLRRCPLVSSIGNAEARAFTIARLGRLTKLNASDISAKERIESERRYVSLVACQLLELLQTKGDDDTKAVARSEFLKSHPQFERLMEQHKDAIAARIHAMDSPQSALSSGGADSSSSTVVVNVNIQSMVPSSCHLEPLVRRLPATLPIKRVKAMCARSFGLDPDLQRLHFSTESDAFPMELDDDEHSLAYYGVSDGATILMNEIDVEELKRHQESVREQNEVKLVEQEAIEMQKQKHKKKLLKS